MGERPPIPCAMSCPTCKAAERIGFCTWPDAHEGDHHCSRGHAYPTPRARWGTI